MPLVLMCGLPASGKTSRCSQLTKYLKDQHKLNVTVIGDTQQSIDKNITYAESKNEKELRGNLKSAVQRSLNKEDVVILDSLNYIKGYRYELFCVCKSARTTLCVIYCDIAPDKIKEFNTNRPENEQYTSDILDALQMRFEPPNAQNRWDSPLFIVRPEENLPCEDIYNALYMQKAPPPNQSTQSQPLSATNYLHELDKITQQIVSHIMTEQKMAVVGDSISIAGAEEKMKLSRNVTLAELQRCRRQFISYTKSQVISDIARIANMFVMYLNKSLN